MKKVTLTTIGLFLCLVFVNAGPVSKQQALVQAQSFMKSIGRNLSSNTTIRRAPKKAAQNDNSYYYVFNADNNNGFVIVSGDDRTEPILGYSDTGTFDLDNLPENAQAFLEEISNEIEYMDAKGLSSQRRVAEPAKRAIAPLLTCIWGQGNPYNYSCPTDPSTNETSVAGCVATAMAQVLYHHRANNVTTLQAEIPAFTTSTRKISMPAIAAGTTIDWNNMIDNFASTYTSTQRKAVADLMLFCGQSVEMNYRSDASGASSYDVPYALRTYFGYDAHTHYKRRAGYDVYEWNEMLYNELKENRPVYYAGSSQGGGHAFVIDGVDEDGLYHVNWGWNGSSNGYFLISVLNPGDNSGIGASSTNDGYIMNGAAIFGAQPTTTPGGSSSYDEMLTAAYDTHSSLEFSYYFYNYTGTKKDFTFGLAVEDANGNLYILGSKSYNIPQGKYANPPITASIKTFTDNNLPTGTYTVIPVSKKYRGSTWYRCLSSNTSKIVLSYTGTSLEAKLISAKALSAVSWEVLGLKKTNMAQRVKVKIKGNDDVDSNTSLYLFAKKSTATSYPTAVSQTVVSVAKGDTTDVEFSFTPTSAGIWNLKVSAYSHSTSSAIFNGTESVTITDAPETFTNGLSATYNIDYASSATATNISVYQNDINGTITLRNDTTVDYVGQVTLALWRNTSGTRYTLKTKSARDVTIPAGGTITLDIKYPNLDYGVKYLVRNYYGLSTDKEKAVKGDRFATIKHGIDKYQLVNGEVARSIEIPSGGQVTVNAQTLALDLTGTNTTKINGTPGQNFLLFLGASDAIPSGASGLNIVRNGTINELNLVDEAPFYSPEEFEANKITYTRTPAIATSGTGGWETLIIPFAATKVMNLTDNQEIDWYHSPSDTDKDFWLRRFTEIDGTDLTFEDVDQMQPNEPYIIAVSDGTVANAKQSNGMMAPRKAPSLQGKQIQFSAENAVIPESKYLTTYTSTYSFLGTFNSLTLPNIHTMNVTGTAFEKQSSGTVAPFRCYFLATNPSSAASVLPLDNVVDAITLPVSDTTDGNVDIYTISGIKIGTAKVVNGQVELTNLPKGIYIVNGKKVVR